MGLGSGMFKSNVSPLIAEQITRHKAVVEVRNGKKVLVDPAMTTYAPFSTHLSRFADVFTSIFFPPQLPSRLQYKSQRLYMYFCTPTSSPVGNTTLT
jgi:hypothetical protein